MRKTDALKTCPKSKFLGKKIWKNALVLRTKKIQGIFGEKLILALLSSTAIRLQNRFLRILLLCSTRGIKGFYQSSLRNEVDFRDLMNVSLNILAKNWNFKKLRHYFVDARALITTTLVSSCHLKTLIPFCSWNKRPENHF